MICMLSKMHADDAELETHCAQLQHRTSSVRSVCGCGVLVPMSQTMMLLVAGTRQAGSALSGYEPVTYNYSWFHMVFALASMYIAMLMTGWGEGAEEKDLLDVGWASVWVKIVSQWVTAGLYLWTLAAPALFPDRIFA